MGGLLAPFAIPVLVYDQNTVLVGNRRRVAEQEFEAALVNLSRVPPGFRKEPLQALCFLTLRSEHGFGVGQSRQGLVALGGEQKALQIAPKTFALGTSPKENIEGLGVVFQRARSRIDGQPFAHGGAPPLVATIEAQSLSHFNKLPIRNCLKSFTSGPNASPLSASSPRT